MADDYEMNPAARLTVGTLGEPGNRTFFLQGINGLESFAIIIEKEQAFALADAIDELLDELESRFELAPARPDRVAQADLALQLPVEGQFRVATLGLGYDEENDMVVIAAQELTAGDDPRVVRFWVTRDQVAALGPHAREVANAGRPLCPLCGQPMDEDGHFCPRSNGHTRH